MFIKKKFVLRPQRPVQPLCCIHLAHQVLLFLVGSVFQFILNGLQDQEQRSASAIAFEHLCVDCCSKMASNFPVILQVSQNDLQQCFVYAN